MERRCPVDSPERIIPSTLQRKERGTRIQPTLHRCCGPLLPTAADAFFHPAHLVNHKTQSFVTLAFATGDSVLDGTCQFLHSWEDQNVQMEVHIGRRGHGSCGRLGERSFGVKGVVGCGDARIKHADIDGIVPFAPDPARVYRGRNWVRVVTVNASAPQMALQDDLLPLAWFQVESWDANSKRTVDRVRLESRELLGLGCVAKLIVQG